MSREGVRWEGGDWGGSQGVRRVSLCRESRRLGDWEFGGSLGDWEFRDSLGLRESRRLGESVSQGVYETGSL